MYAVVCSLPCHELTHTVEHHHEATTQRNDSIARWVFTTDPPQIRLIPQVLGHFKLVVILAAGVTMFGEHAEPLRLLGMAVALAGIVGYTTLKQSLGSGWERKSARSARSDDDVDAENVGEQARNIKRNTTAGPVYTVKRH